MGDLLFDFAGWLRTTFLVELARWIAETPASWWIVTNFWAIPIFQVVHILAIAGSFAAVLMIVLRVYGFAGHASLGETVRRYAGVLWWSLAVLLLSGLAMIVGEPERALLNPIFWIKIAMVIAGVLVAARFTGRLRRELSASDAMGGATRAAAGFLALWWCAIMFAGRWIAYAPI